MVAPFLGVSSAPDQLRFIVIRNSAVDIVVSDALRNLAQRAGGVRPEQAIDAIETRDEVHHLSIHTIRVSLYLKRTDTAPPSWVLAQVIPTLRYVEVAWRIYDDMCPGIEEMTPLGVLSAAAPNVSKFRPSSVRITFSTSPLIATPLTSSSPRTADNRFTRTLNSPTSTRLLFE